MMPTPKVNQLPPFVPVDLRVWIEAADAEETAVVGTIRYLQWQEGPDADLPLPLIHAAMPGGKDGISERQLKRVLARIRAKGWVVTKRVAKGRLGRSAPTYQLAIEPLPFSSARHTINQRANLASRSERPTGQLELTKGPESTDQGATQAPPNIQEKDLKERPKRKTESPAKPATGPHPQQDVFWLQAKATWERAHPGAKLDWPRLKGFPAALRSALEVHGATELARRWDNMVADPFSRPSLMALVTDPDKWTAPRTKGAPHARATFQQPAIGYVGASSGR